MLGSGRSSDPGVRGQVLTPWTPGFSPAHVRCPLGTVCGSDKKERVQPLTRRQVVLPLPLLSASSLSPPSSPVRPLPSPSPLPAPSPPCPHFARSGYCFIIFSLTVSSSFLSSVPILCSFFSPFSIPANPGYVNKRTSFYVTLTGKKKKKEG